MGAVVTALPSILTIVLTRHFERSKELAIKYREIEREIRKNSIPAYEDLQNFLLKVVHGVRDGKPVPKEEVIAFFDDIVPKVQLWGSDKFIKDFSTLRTYKNANDSNEIAYVMENLFYSIRSDCGHDNKGLGRGDLLALYINDLPKQKRRWFR